MELPRIINLPKMQDARGNLSVIEESGDLPFSIARAYWIYDVPGGETRDGHAFRRNKDFIVALSGSFDVLLSNGKEERRFALNRSYYGLYVPNGWWRSINNFSTNAVALIAASTKYDAEDYIEDFDDYKKWRNAEFHD